MVVQRTSVGLDVHARSVVACALDGLTGQIFERRLSPDYRGVTAWVSGLPGPVAVTYEAGPTGFGLARHLAGEGIVVQVAAPSKLLRPSGDRVKTDLLTELADQSLDGRVRRPTVLARFHSRDQRRGCAAGVVRAGGAAAWVP